MLSPDLALLFRQIVTHKNNPSPHPLLHANTTCRVDIVMPHGSSATPGWFVEGVNEVLEGFEP